MAAKYGCLPSELVNKGDTTDIKFHLISETYKERQRMKKSGDPGDLANSFTQSEINEVYNKWRNSE